MENGSSGNSLKLYQRNEKTWWMLSAAAGAVSPRWISGKWERAHWLLGWRMVAEEILGGGAVSKGTETSLHWASHLDHLFWGHNLEILLQLEERWQQVTQQLQRRMAAAAQNMGNISALLMSLLRLLQKRQERFSYNQENRGYSVQQTVF